MNLMAASSTVVGGRLGRKLSWNAVVLVDMARRGSGVDGLMFVDSDAARENRSG